MVGDYTFRKLRVPFFQETNKWLPFLDSLCCGELDPQADGVVGGFRRALVVERPN